MRKVIPHKRLTKAHRFERLVEPHFDALFSAARRMTMSHEAAEDLVQEICIKAFDALDALEAMEFPRAWLLRSMYHHFVDDLRRAERSPIGRSSTGVDSGEPDQLASILRQPDELVDQEQQVERVLRALRLLRADHAALLAMHDVEGVSIDEIVRLTGMPAGTIKAQLHRTRKKLGRLLSNDAVLRPQLRVIGGRNEM